MTKFFDLDPQAFLANRNDRAALEAQANATLLAWAVYATNHQTLMLRMDSSRSIFSGPIYRLNPIHLNLQENEDCIVILSAPLLVTTSPSGTIGFSPVPRILINLTTPQSLSQKVHDALMAMENTSGEIPPGRSFFFTENNAAAELLLHQKLRFNQEQEVYEVFDQGDKLLGLYYPEKRYFLPLLILGDSKLAEIQNLPDAIQDLFAGDFPDQKSFNPGLYMLGEDQIPVQLLSSFTLDPRFLEENSDDEEEDDDESRSTEESSESAEEILANAAVSHAATTASSSHGQSYIEIDFLKLNTLSQQEKIRRLRILHQYMDRAKIEINRGLPKDEVDALELLARDEHSFILNGVRYEIHLKQDLIERKDSKYEIFTAQSQEDEDAEKPPKSLGTYERTQEVFFVAPSPAPKNHRTRAKRVGGGETTIADANAMEVTTYGNRPPVKRSAPEGVEEGAQKSVAVEYIPKKEEFQRIDYFLKRIPSPECFRALLNFIDHVLYRINHKEIFHLDGSPEGAFWGAKGKIQGHTYYFFNPPVSHESRANIAYFQNQDEDEIFDTICEISDLVPEGGTAPEKERREILRNTLQEIVPASSTIAGHNGPIDIDWLKKKLEEIYKIVEKIRKGEPLTDQDTATAPSSSSSTAAAPSSAPHL